MFRFTIRDVLWLTVVVGMIVWSQVRHAKQTALLEAERVKAVTLEANMRMWEGRAGAVAQTMRNLGVPVTFNDETRGMSTGPLPAYIRDHDRSGPDK